MPQSNASGLNAAAQLGWLLDGYLTTQLLYVAAKLGVADVLQEGPRSAADVATAVGADRAALTRVLRGLAAEDVLAETDDGRFGLTPIGECLGALRGAALVRGDLYWRSAAGLLGHHGAHDAEFELSMAGRAEQEAGDVTAVYDFSGLAMIVDVGGGRGVLLGAILRSTVEASGVLADRPATVNEARAFLESDGLADRVECVAIDFFAAVPGGGDAYVLSRVLHDWDDADAERILARCREAMSPTSRLLIVEAILPERARDKPAAIRMDVHMLLLFGARERTEVEFRNLLSRSGFRVARVVTTPSPAGLSVIEATVVLADSASAVVDQADGTGLGDGVVGESP